MNRDVRLIETVVHGRYLVRSGPPNVLVGFHGYAQTAELQLTEMEMIPGVESWTLVSVQALHPFYTRSEEVVASWMTRLDREEAIADNVEYVRRIVAALGEARRLVFIGFSQGVAMAWRAASISRCNGVIALGGDVPPDVTANSLPPSLLARGRRDEWYGEEKFKKDLSSLAGRSAVTTCVYEGGHEWSDEFRETAGEWLAGRV